MKNKNINEEIRKICDEITKTENKDKYLLTTPLAVYQISEHLRDNNEKQFVKAMLGV